MSASRSDIAGPVTIRRDGRVGVLTIADAAGRNAMSPELAVALPAALGGAAADPGLHVLVVSGLPTVFATGASREYLLSETPADVEPLVRAFLHCPLPVIAAMQGHAFGGGLSQGLYADVPVLSERSCYAANFLEYGLVPSYGTTWLLADRLGAALAAEMLATARPYRGSQLRARSAPVAVVPHDRVLPHCLELARDAARAPRAALELLKTQLATPMRLASDAAIAVENGPHHRSWELADRPGLVARRYGRPEVHPR